MFDEEKKFKKMQIEEGDSNEKAIEKLNKLLDELSKGYEAASKQLFKTKQARSKIEVSNSHSIQVKLRKKRLTSKR